MNDPTLLADLVRAGLSDELVNRVATALHNVRDSPGHVRDIVRAYETGRKRKQRETSDKLGRKQTMSVQSSDHKKPVAVRDNASERCDTSFLSSSSSEVQRSKEEKSSRRGSRLQFGQAISPEAWQFAHEQGFGGPQIEKLWAEFVDYWAALPGQRGLKLDWLATWRNRVRQIAARKGPRNGGGNSVMEALDHAIDRAGGDEVEGNPPMVDVTPRRP